MTCDGLGTIVMQAHGPHGPHAVWWPIKIVCVASSFVTYSLILLPMQMKALLYSLVVCVHSSYFIVERGVPLIVRLMFILDCTFVVFVVFTTGVLVN